MKSTNYYFILAVLFGSIGGMSSDLYLPSLPYIASELHTTIALTQFSVALFVFGLAFARLIIATVSDALGRKIPLIFSLIVCTGGCLLCLFATNIHMLLIGRLFQGFGAGGSNILARVILRDKAEDTKLAQYNSYFSMVGITLMAAAPLLGGYLQHYFDWRASFLTLLIYTITALFVCLFLLSETNPNRHHNLLKPTILKTNFLSLFVHKQFIIYALFLLLGYGTMVAWLTSGAIVLQKVVLLSPIQFGWCAALVGFFYFIGAYINSRFVGKLGIHKMLQIGTICFLAGGISMLIPITIFNHTNTVVFIIPVIIAMFGISFLIPNCYAAGLTPFAKTAGIAVAILGTIQMLGGTLASSIISIVPDRNQLPLGLIIFISAILCLVLLAKIRKSNLKSN